MHKIFLAAALLALATGVCAQSCTLQTFDAWDSDFDLTPLDVRITITTRISFDPSGTFSSVSSYQGDCFVDVNGTYSFTTPDLLFTGSTVDEARPNPTSLACELLHVASLAIGDESFLPSSNVTFSADCSTFNMTFFDAVGVAQTRQFAKANSCLLIPSVLMLLLAISAHLL